MARIVNERDFYPIVCSRADAATPHWKCENGDATRLGAYLEVFEQPPEPSEVLAWIDSEGLECFDAAAERLRYVYVTVDGPMWPQASVEAAVDAYRTEIARSRGHSTSTARGDALGYLGPGFLAESRDGLGVLEWSVSVVGGVVRGLAQNHSERLWARNVAVTVTDADGTEGMWQFPLAVQPGELMPFEIEDWTGSDVPSEIRFDVSADLSPTIDLSRSLMFRWGWVETTREEFLAYFPHEATVGVIPEGTFEFLELIIERAAPTAQPRLAEAARQQTISNLVAYSAAFDSTGAVSDVFELIPMALVSDPHGWVEVRTIPAELPDGRVSTSATFTAVGGIPMIWVGGSAADAEHSSESQ